MNKYNYCYMYHLHSFVKNNESRIYTGSTQDLSFRLQTHRREIRLQKKNIKRIGEKLKLYGLKYSKHEKKLIIENLYLNNHIKTFMIVVKKT